MALIAIPRTRTVRGIVIAAALAVAGMWLKRFLIVVPPLAGSSSYTPTWVEAAVTLGAIAAIPLLLMIIFRFVPVFSIWEMEEEETAVIESTEQPGTPGLPVAREVV